MSKKRRNNLLNRLKKNKQAIKGAELAKEFSVSRQVIVKDIALLRAAGKEIIATSNGYLMPRENNLKERIIACNHKPTDVREELQTVISFGGRAKDVIIEHSIYGEIKGNLGLQSSSDIDSFIKKYESNQVKLLSSLTNGTHLHTIEALNEEVLDLIEQKLAEKGFILKE